MMDAKEVRHTGPVLRTGGLEMQYGEGEGVVRALDGVELEVASGEALAVMGSRRCCISWAAWSALRPGRCGSPGAASTSSARRRSPECAATRSASSFRPFT